MKLRCSECLYIEICIELGFLVSMVFLGGIWKFVGTFLVFIIIGLCYGIECLGFGIFYYF